MREREAKFLTLEQQIGDQRVITERLGSGDWNVNEAVNANKRCISQRDLATEARDKLRALVALRPQVKAAEKAQTEDRATIARLREECAALQAQKLVPENMRWSGQQ